MILRFAMGAALLAATLAWADEIVTLETRADATLNQDDRVARKAWMR